MTKLSPNLNKEKWTVKEYEQLFAYFKQYGNFWKKIATKFEGRSDNSIKNHFFSIIRKFLRKMVKLVGYNNKYTCSEIVNKVKPRLLLQYIKSSISLEYGEEVKNYIVLEISTVIKRYGFKSFHELKRNISDYDLKIIEKSLTLLADINANSTKEELMEKSKKIKKEKMEGNWRTLLKRKRGIDGIKGGNTDNMLALKKKVAERISEISNKIGHISLSNIGNNKEGVMDTMNKLMASSESIRNLMIKQKLLSGIKVRVKKPKEFQISFNFVISNQRPISMINAVPIALIKQAKGVNASHSFEDKIHLKKIYKNEKISDQTNKPHYYRFKDVIKEIMMKEKGNYRHLDDFLKAFIYMGNKTPSEPLIKLLKCEEGSTDQEEKKQTELVSSKRERSERQTHQGFRRLLMTETSKASQQDND